ncbi:hemicentin-1 isoform X2 [Clupea harengus]|uniref:Hemicentin-1 isoform X2 n=1 Tax=Clupea harengus TaxID=7950 RepID=A0A6P8F053_CLUHA|nr:hemicentin-1 isoform X2 [Clupea harengus]
MDFFLWGLLWVTVLCPVDYYVSSQACAGKEPVIDPPSLVVKYGGLATANCSAQSEALIIGWETTVGAITEYDTQQLVWSVPSVTEWALGRGIKCFTTSDEDGQCETDLPITIYKIPENMILSLLDHTGALLEGQQYWLECVVQSVAPANHLIVIWSRGDTELKRSGFPQFSIEGDQSKDVTVRTKLSLTASREDHEASYHCEAKLDLNTAEPIPETRSSIQLEAVFYKPRVLQTSGNVTIFAGNKLELMCVADANPRPSYQWRHKGVVLPNKNNNTLLIDSATADNAGVYECVISNTQGQASAVMSIEVKGQDCAGKEPVIYPPSLVVKYGEPATAKCSAQSNATIIGWEATVGAKTENDIQQLVWSVPSVTEWALGRGIECFTSSEKHGQCLTHLPITIYKTPENVILRVLNDTGPLLEGQEYWLQCVVESVAPANNLIVIWSRGDTELKRSGFPQFFIEGDESKNVTVATHLSLTASREDHGASYRCAAKLDLNTAEFIPETRSSIQLEVYYKPRVIKTSGNVTIDAGNKLELMCEADANPRPSYQWRHKGVVLPNKDKNTLLIDSATADNAGVYECVISNTQGQASAVMSIEVKGQDCAGKEPVIDPPSLVVRYGGPATAKCSAQSEALIIRWETTVGDITENDLQQLVWSVPSVTEWALGRGIWCFTISDEHGQCDTHLPITIYKIPENVTLGVLNHTGPLLEGQQYWLECVVERVAPAKNLAVIWSRGDTELKRSGFPQFSIEGDLSKDVTVRTKLSLTASREDHGASYRCAAKLDLNTAEPIPETRSSIQLELFYKPRVLQTSGNVTIDAGTKLELMCVADANPRPSYQWRHKGVVLPNKDKNTLLIDSATADNAGVYECVISNTQGQASAVMSIEVKDKPRVIKTSGNVTIDAGKKLELMCVADANPRPSYQWRHKGVVLPNKDKNTLLIDSATADNAGVYECVISNTQGQASAVMSIEVKGSQVGLIIGIVVLILVVAVGVCLGRRFWLGHRVQSGGGAANSN